MLFLDKEDKEGLLELPLIARAYFAVRCAERTLPIIEAADDSYLTRTFNTALSLAYELVEGKGTDFERKAKIEMAKDAAEKLTRILNLAERDTIKSPISSITAAIESACDIHAYFEERDGPVAVYESAYSTKSAIRAAYLAVEAYIFSGFGSKSILKPIQNDLHSLQKNINQLHKLRWIPKDYLKIIDFFEIGIKRDLPEIMQLAIQVPESMKPEEARRHLVELVKLADEHHRSLGGKGLKIAGVEVEKAEHILEPVS